MSFVDLCPAFEKNADPFSDGVSLTIRGLARSFGSTKVLSGLDLDVPTGQFVAIVGRSGCGKSTLLRLIAGLDEPTEGRLRFAGKALARSGPSFGGPNLAGHSLVRVMFQEPRLLPWARVMANVEIGLGAVESSPQTRQRVIEALEAVGLAERAGEWPFVLSGGQKQRVALARALISRPQLLAFDEPLGALDALTRIEMQRLLERIWLRDRFTAILVTHDVMEALTLADRVLLIESGRVTLDLAVDLPRPRRRGSAELAQLEEGILDRLLGDEQFESCGSARSPRR
ncbi:ATP-binding cassette domain-containing protein [Methylocapsa aurea]|uniref:ATP-binding cassette domain-containing protein n=1 Tax=Methylocapsa aurea TaxID=663610 RepID=UPI00068C70F1|nr:ATP-binding cassette domain-containing protein [Methylocapsa aurea]